MNKYILISVITLSIIFILVTSYYIYKHYIIKSPKQIAVKTIKIQYERPKIVNGRQEPQTIYDFHLEPQLGYISNWFVQNDTKVYKNQPIVEYYNPTIEKTIAQKQQLLATLTHEQHQKVDINQLINLKDEISTLQQKLRTKIIAPFDGVLTIKFKTPSTTRQSFATLYQPKYHISATIPETYISSLKTGHMLKIRSTNKETSTNEKITHINSFPNNFATSEKHSTYEIKLTSSAKVPIGQHFEIEIPSNTIIIPKKALLDNRYVLIKKSNKFVKRVIKFSKSGNNNHIKVISGLSPGEIIAQNAKSVNYLN